MKVTLKGEIDISGCIAHHFGGNAVYANATFHLCGLDLIEDDVVGVTYQVDGYDHLRNVVDRLIGDIGEPPATFHFDQIEAVTKDGGARSSLL